MMKKAKFIIAVFLAALALVFCAGCDKASGKKHANSSVIDKTEGYEALTLIENGNESIELVHVDRKSCPDKAEAYLSVAEICLADSGIKSEIKDLYRASLGLAGLEYGHDPVMILCADEGLNEDPLFMVAVSYADSLIYTGCFKGSEAGGHYRDASSLVVNKYIDARAKELGLFAEESDNNQIMFNIFKLNGYDSEEVPAEISGLFKDADARLHKYGLADWFIPGQASEFVNDYYTVPYDYIRSFSDVEAWLGECFTADIAKRTVEACREIYKEEDGVLKAPGIGLGWSIDLCDYYPVKLIRLAEDHCYLIVEAKRMLIDWDTGQADWENPEYYYQEYLFELSQDNKGWVFCDFTDIAYGFV